MEGQMVMERNPLEVMGNRIAEIQDRILLETDVLSKTKAEMSFDPFNYDRPARRPGFAAVAVAAAAGIALLIGLAVLLGVNKDNTMTVAVAGQTLADGDWISTAGEDETTLTFSDGSTVTLRAHSGIRIQKRRSNGAHLLLERGALVADVVHRGNTKWQLDVGPYVISITGTRFFVSWNPEKEVFNLEMAEGSVDVRGPLVTTGKRMETGESMVAALASKRLTFYSGTTPAPPESVVFETDEMSEPELDNDKCEPGEESVAPTDNIEKPVTTHRRQGRQGSGAASRWRVLLDSGNESAAVRAAQRFGIANITASASADDLMMLGDFARHVGKVGLATKIYKAARRRFKGSPYAVRATFALGIMAFDQKNAHLEAAKWFSLIAANGPRGGLLVKEASGRLVEALQKGGETARAEEAARRYLEIYPHGPHAALAKRLTQ
jgi:transmembrane sensor